MFVVLVRHAEPATGGTDPGLSQGGARRATRLAKMLADAGITDIFTSDLRRTRETAQPLASLSSITPVVIASNPAAAAAQIRAAGKRVLVVGHTNTVPLIIKALGGPPDVVIKPKEFNRLLVLHLPAQGADSLLTMRYPT